MPRLFAAIAILVLLSGCSTPASEDLDGTGNGQPTAPEALAAWKPTWAPLDAADIRPGMAAPGCTFDWAFVDPVAGAYFIGLAAHCTSNPDANNVEDGTGTRTGGAGFTKSTAWGTIVFDSDNATLQTDLDIEERVDFSLIRLDEGVNLRTHPQMMGFPAPVGFIACEETVEGDAIGWHGYGMVFGEAEPTRTRQGALAFCDGRDYGAYTAAIWGDSGSAVVHVATMKALGIVSRLGVESTPPTELMGATVDYILRELAKHPDFADVRLATIDGGYVGLEK